MTTLTFVTNVIKYFMQDVFDKSKKIKEVFMEDKIQLFLGSSVLTMCFSCLQLIVTSFILYALSEWKWERRNKS